MCVKLHISFLWLLLVAYLSEEIVNKLKHYRLLLNVARVHFKYEIHIPVYDNNNGMTVTLLVTDPVINCVFCTLDGQWKVT